MGGVVRVGLVGLGHLVDLFLPLHRGALALVRVGQFLGQALGHRLTLFLILYIYKLDTLRNPNPSGRGSAMMYLAPSKKAVDDCHLG